MEVGKEVRVDGEVLRRVFVVHFDLDCLAKIHGSRFIYIEDRCVGNGDLDTVAHILSLEDDLPDRLDPLLATGNRIRRQKDALLVRPQPEVFLSYSITRDGISEIDYTMGEIWILS